MLMFIRAIDIDDMIFSLLMPLSALTYERRHEITPLRCHSAMLIRYCFEIIARALPRHFSPFSHLR